MAIPVLPILQYCGAWALGCDNEQMPWRELDMLGGLLGERLKSIVVYSVLRIYVPRQIVAFLQNVIISRNFELFIKPFSNSISFVQTIYTGSCFIYF